MPESVRKKALSKNSNNEIIELKRTMEKLIHWSSVVENSDDAIFGKTLDGIITSWNYGAQKMYGYTYEEIVGKTVLNLFPDELRGSFHDIMSRIKRGIAIDHYETIRVRKDGTRIPVSVTISPIRDISGTIIGASSIARNISDRIVADEANSRLAAIVQSSDDAIIGKDLNNIITNWNLGAEKIYGFTESEMVGQSIAKITPADKLHELDEIMAKINQGKPVEHFETMRIRKDGRLINVSITVSPIRNTVGDIIGASTVARDVSYRVDMEKRRKEFVNTISHELNTPLTSQKVYIELLKGMIESNGENQYLPYIIKIWQQNEKLSKLVGELLELSRSDSGKLSLHFTLFDLGELVKEVVSDLEQTCTQKILLEEVMSESVLGDRDRIYQVLANLLTNAIKYSGKGDTIIVSSRIDPQKGIIVSVKDFGIGIAKKDHKQIFERFYRSSNVEVLTYPGMGIGLHVAKEFINLHHGDIWVESQKGKGATFSFSLPLPPMQT